MLAPTVSDCLEHARSAEDGGALEAHLRQGEQLARSDSDWRHIGKAYAECGERDAARRCFDTAIAIAPGQTWCFADKAQLLRDAFDDVSGATSVLRECETNLAAHAGGPGYRWSLLAGHFHTIVNDAEAARQCLDQGTQRARSIDELCSMARAYSALLADTSRARTLLQRAMPMARDEATRTPQEIAGYGSISSVYSGLGENRTAREFLDEGLELASSVDACVTLAQASAGQPVDPEPSVRRCLQRGESLAASSRDWLSIAEAYHEHAKDPAECRTALERATEGADDAGLRRVAMGFAHWVGDGATAHALAPLGVRPAELAVHRKPLEGWDADAGSLLALLLESVSDEALDSIADADYGYKRDDNRAALEDLRREGLAPIPMVSALHEVMELTRWSRGERVDHVERALACTLLCLDVLHDDSFTGDITATLAPLVQSCWKLGPNPQRALSGFLVWLFEAMRGAEEKAWEDDPDVDEEDLDTANDLAAQYGLLLTQLFVAPADPRLDALCTSVLEMERRMNAWNASDDDDAPWMSRVLRTINLELWSELATEALARAERAVPDGTALRRLRPLID